MSHFDTYRDGFPNARLTRSKTGVLEVALPLRTIKRPAAVAALSHASSS
jgi:hypothetical protein